MITTIGGTTVSLLTGSLKIRDLLREPTIASFIVVDTSGVHELEQGEPVYVKTAAGSTVYHFGGVVQSAREEHIGVGATLLHHVECTDWTYKADKRIAVKAYTDQGSSAIVTDLLTSYLSTEGVTAGTISTGPVISEAVFNYVPVTQALNSLADKAGFWWWVDPYKRLHFRGRTANPAPWTLNSTDALEGTVRLEHGNPLYRNRQFIRGGRDITDQQTEYRKGDGVATAFTLSYPLALEPNVYVKRAASTYSAQTVGVRAVETAQQWYWSKGDLVVSQASTGTVLSSTDMLKLEYYGQYDIVYVSWDQTAIDSRKALEGEGTGYVEDVAEEPEVTDKAAAAESAAAKLRSYAQAGKKLQFRTRSSGLEPGQLLTVNIPIHGLSSEEFLIESVVTSERGNDVRYDIVATAGPVQGSWLEFFRSLDEDARPYVIRENISTGQVLVSTTSFPESWGWSESVSQSVYACSVPSTSLFPSTGLIPC